MRAKGVAFISACLLTFSACANAQTDSPTQAQIQAPRIASTSLCGDGYVLAHYPDSQIAALSWQSRSALSLATDKQRALPQAWVDAERLIALAPDYVLFGPGEGHNIEPLLNAANIQTLRLDWAEDEAALLSNFAKLGKVFTPPSAHVHPKPLPRILYLSRAGGTAGAQTFIDVAITRAGGQNVWSRSGWFTPETEQLAALKPNLIITSFISDGYDSAQDKLISGKAVKTLFKDIPKIDIPGALWPCMGPHFYKAVSHIRSGVEALP